MVQLGSGLEYKVFDQLDGRVLKIRRAIPSRVLRSLVHSLRARDLARWPRVVRILLPDTNGVPGLVACLATMSARSRKLFGNIDIVRGNDYTQDKVVPLRDYLEGHSFEESVAVAHGYVTLIRSLWSLGIGDPYYNFLWNSGVYADGTVIQLDVADLVTNEAVLSGSTQRQVWLRTGMAGIADEALRAEFERIFNEGLTFEEFKARWPAEPIFPEISHPQLWVRYQGAEGR